MQNVTARLMMALLMAACLALVGCESDGGDTNASSTTDNGTPQGTPSFYGVYAGTIEGAGPGTVTVGSDKSRGGEDAQPGSIYLYIPATGNTETYSKVQADGNNVTVTVTIAGRTITEYAEGKWHGGGSGEVTATWSSDYNSVTFSGRGVDQEAHAWAFTGTATRIE